MGAVHPAPRGGSDAGVLSRGLRVVRAVNARHGHGRRPGRTALGRRRAWRIPHAFARSLGPATARRRLSRSRLVDRSHHAGGGDLRDRRLADAEGRFIAESKRLTERLLASALTVESVLNEGSTFRVVLPVAAEGV